jgi:hypothetical protein
MTNGKPPKEESTATQVLDRQPISKCERAILSVLAQHGRLTLTQATIIARYSTTSSGPVNAASRLRTQGYIKGFNIDGVDITESGRAILGDFDPLPTGRALAEFWYRELGKCEAAILRVVVDAYPKSVALNDAATLSDPPYSLESSGPVNAASKLRTLCLVNGKNTGMIANERLIG